MSRATTTAETVTDIESLTYNGDLRWLGFERHDPYLFYRFRDEDRTSSWSRSQEAGLGTTFRVTDKFDLGGHGTYQGNEDPGFSRDRSGIVARAGYRIPLSFGRLSLTGSVGANRNEQESTTDTIKVFDERVTLAGVAPVFLSASFVLEDTVMVTNVAQTQTFVEDFDYRLVTIGSTTTIERVITGNIFDGQEVLVSYEFRTGGTTEYRDTNQSIGVALGFSKYLSMYAQWFNVDNAVKSGNPTVPLNDVTNLEAGVSVDVPFATNWSVGGQIRYTKRDETISPAVSTLFDLYLRTGHYRGVAARLGLTKETVDNEFSTEDVDQLRYFVSLSCRLPGAAQLSYTYSNAEDDGGSVTTKNKQQRLQFDWRYRLVIFTLRASQDQSEQGTGGRENTRVTAELRRSF